MFILSSRLHAIIHFLHSPSSFGKRKYLTLLPRVKFVWFLQVATAHPGMLNF